MTIAFAGCAVVGVVAAARRDARLGALALLGAAGMLRTLAVTRSDDRCLERALATAMPDSGAIHVAVVEAMARPGSRVPATLRDGGCRVRASIAVARGSAPAGARVAVRGVGARSGPLVVLDQATLVPIAPPGLARRWRERAGHAIDASLGNDAPLARALLIADTRTLDAGIRTRYADAGIVHLLSVSGLHVAIIAGAVELLLAAARVSRVASSWLALLMTAAYVVMIGLPAPALRAAVMLGAGAVSRLTQRPTSPWASLALGAWAPLADARVVHDLGYQLSVAGLAALIAAGALSRRLLGGRLSGWRRVVVRDLIASTTACIVTLPLIAWTFGRLSLVAPLTNLAAGPVFAVLQPTLFLTLVLSPVPALASVPADASHVLLGAVDAIARAATALPWAALPVAPTLWTAACLGVVAAALVVACSAAPDSAWTARALIAGAATVATLALGLRITGGGGLVELHMMDVGQGDALALRTPRGNWLLFDAGRAWTSGDAGRSTIIPYLLRRGGSLHAFVLSHPHADHVGGGASVVRALDPLEYWDGAYVSGSPAYRASLDATRESGTAWHRVHPGDTLRVDGVRVRFLAPDSLWTTALPDANEASAVALIEYGRVRFLMTGDAEAGEEAWMLAHARGELRADVLKVGHHGSSTSTTPEFLDAVRPRVALVSVGASNTYGHPSAAVIRSLRAAGAEVLRTDHVGTVVVRTDGRTLTIDAGGEQWVR